MKGRTQAGGVEKRGVRKEQKEVRVRGTGRAGGRGAWRAGEHRDDPAMFVMWRVCVALRAWRHSVPANECRKTRVGGAVREGESGESRRAGGAAGAHGAQGKSRAGKGEDGDGLITSRICIVSRAWRGGEWENVQGNR